MKYLVVSRADGKINPMTSLTLPHIQRYASQCGADFKILDQEPPVWTNEHPPRPHYRIMILGELFNEYDRILVMDSDVVVNKDIPNIFDIVPYDCIGTIFEDVGSATEHRRGQIRKVQEQFGEIEWEAGYPNTGFILFSKCHSDIFTPINGRHYFMDFGYDDVHLAYQWNRLGMSVYQLEYRWNHMTMFSEPWHKADRFQSYIIHYAGEGVFDRGEVSNRTEQIRRDLQRIYG